MPVMPQIMGILNVTPDSFSDGGRFVCVAKAVEHAVNMVEAGADFIDIGGESTRPGATPISVSEELDRVLPVIEQIKKVTAIPLSIDTRHTVVMKAALEAGASMINDVAALQAAGAMELAAQYQVPVCLMHMQNTPENMQHAPEYDDVVQVVYTFLEQRIRDCLKAGIAKANIWVDPGFGFGKTLEHNLTLLGQLSQFKTLGCPLLVGLSRKRLFGQLLGKPVEQRLYGSLAGVVLSVLQGADIVRVHDVAATKDALVVASSILPYWQSKKECAVAT